MKDLLAERVLTLERRLSGLQSEVDAANARTAMTAGAYQMRIGRITGEPEDSDNTFDVIFEDGTFTEAAGQQSPDYIGRQLAARAVVHNLAAVKIPKDTRLPCWYWSDRWWTWWKESTTTEGGDPKMCGFNDIHPMTSLTYNENRIATFLGEDMIGSISGLEWDDDDKVWTVEIGDWFIEWGTQGHVSCPLPNPYPGTGFPVNYIYSLLEQRNVPDDDEPDPSWSTVPSSLLYQYSHFSGYWNSASRGYLLRLTDDPQQIRMACGIGQSSGQSCSTGHIYDAHWHWTKAEFG